MEGKNLLKGYELLGIAAIGAILIFSVLISGCVENKGQIGENSYVKVNITDENNVSSVKYISINESKNGFEKQLIGMKVGDEKEVSTEEIISVRLQHEPEMGKVYNTLRGELKIFNVTDKEISFGHKLTGEKLFFDVKIKNISDTTSLRISCLKKYNVSADVVVFYYSNSCPHCHNMMPLIRQLENESKYKFLWIEGSDTDKVKIAYECMNGVLNFNQGVPQFGCPSNGAWQIGEFRSKADMEEFSKNCKDAAKGLEGVNASTSEVKKGSAIEVEYVGKLENGEKFDNGTISFVVGSGQMIKGFDEGVVGMKVGETKKIEIPPEKGYGTLEQLKPILREIPQDITMAQFKQVFNAEPVLNKKYSIESNPWPLKVVKINTKSTAYKIKILEIMTAEEYENATNKVEGKLFIMSYCPYGLQAMKGFLPVMKKFENVKNADLEISFVHYTMHGQQEVDENNRMMCIEKEQKDKFIDYTICFVTSGKSEECLSSAKINQEKLSDCIKNRVVGYMDNNNDESKSYGVSGSPTLVINGKIVLSGRSQEAFKQAICNAFKHPQKVCDEIMDSANPSAGFGGGTGSGTSASCG